MAAYNYSISCLLRKPFPFPWVVVAIAAALGCLLLAISHSQGFGFLTFFLTSSLAMLLCPVILYNHKQVVSTSWEPLLLSTAEEHDESPLKLRNQQQDEDEDEEKDEVKEEEEEEEEEESNKKAEVLLSDSESVEDHTTSSEDYSENEGSISDEESLIEIVLPRGQYNNNNNNNNSNNGVQQKWSDCSLQSHFRHQNWMELMQTELFSDENFIEIDLCMGSIKCPRFEIQA